jgi:hypothetical protein
VLVVETERMDHVQDEERPHAVVAEALPHLGEEECREAAGVPEEPALQRADRAGGGTGVIAERVVQGTVGSGDQGRFLCCRMG